MGPLAIFAAATVVAAEPLVITADTTLDPTQTYGPLIIKASDITVDGRGAWIVGSSSGRANARRGEGISAAGVSQVTLKNVNAKGWETGLHVVDARGWTIENCNFSDNFHDPGFGWEENGRRGGIVLERVTSSTLRGNKANRVWDGCVLVHSHDNLLEGNDFSHASNTCLKLWTACRNTVRNNDLSYGLRIDPGEVHARDSACVLIESGSNDNRFAGNNCTHGGDGIFVRVLNGWVSTGNTFEGNDCSYANNNCIEAWSPRNTWIRNKANHGSYGFWLGASDQNVLVENEASFNGLPDGFHNSPHLPDQGHAGIVFMFGPSSHTIVRGNVCEGNNGAGIAAIGDLESQGRKWNAFHWIIEQNSLIKNRWGIFLQHALMFDLGGNRFVDNSSADLYQAENVRGLLQHRPNIDIREPPRAALHGPTVAKVGDKVTFDAMGSRDPASLPLTFRWFVWPDIERRMPTLSQTFTTPGFRRVGLTVNNGLLSDLAWRDLYVVEDLPELGTETNADAWSWIDPESTVQFAVDGDTRLIGQHSIRANVDPYGGGRVTLRCTLYPPLPLAGKPQLVFWLKVVNENIPAWQDVNPLVTLTDRDGVALQLTPAVDFLGAPPYIEARKGWTYVCVPLAGDQDWKRQGGPITGLSTIDLGFDSWGAPPLVIWIDGLGLSGL
jgi:parallel beta-helix repeat protein